MLAKSHRLTREEFSQYFKSGKRIHKPTATLIVAPHENFHGAVIVSKKVSKKAVVRNKLRRRVYAQLYRAYKNNYQGVYIIIIKPQFLDLTRQQQHREIQDLIEQVK